MNIISNIEMQKSLTTVDMPSTAFQQQHEDIQPCHDLMGGTEAMRRAGERYIQKEQGEAAGEWDVRVGRTVLRNVFAQTIKYNRGQVFSRPVALDNTGGIPTDEDMIKFEEWRENVDQRGKNLTSWAGDVFAQGLVDGITFVLVDYPSITTREENGTIQYQNYSGEWRRKTIAADKEEGWQPYFVHIPVAQVLDCQAEWRNGKYVITHFRFLKIATEPKDNNPWGEELVQYIYAYWVDRWEVYRKREADTEFILQGQGQMTLLEIPVAVFMPGDRRTDFTARPALMDLAWLNIRHWQATSEQYDLLAYARRPVWFFSGVDVERDEQGRAKVEAFGPGHVKYLPQGATLASVGVDPTSIEAGRLDLKDLEEAMASYGL